MSYQQQPYQQPYQPQQQYYGYQQQPAQVGSPGTAIIAGILALGLAATFGGAVVDLLVEFKLIDNLDQIPGGMLGILVARAAVAVFALLGAILLFARRSGGAVLTILAAIAGLVTVVVEPMTSELFAMVGVDFGQYLEGLFAFDSTYGTLLALGVIAAPLAFLFAVLPSTFRWCRGRQVSFPQY
ncbi:hypothetical protein [Actinokineospora sp. NBRC 105648]|uniref:hypothetical protein n=1 Tax=Actinokineospora sp. NBRC 105648 TaxID=3032206 RepID=UPI0024A2E339|nr:hypothetical protein [Actinokineospora sp. NBRC 105648]GLZ39884.1 hypothetical protein Acsp05_35080 [Actinokineospora sp. NBRC 105648]